MGEEWVKKGKTLLLTGTEGISRAVFGKRRIQNKLILIEFRSVISENAIKLIKALIIFISLQYSSTNH